jgi:hypothetical protein
MRPGRGASSFHLSDVLTLPGTVPALQCELKLMTEETFTGVATTRRRSSWMTLKRPRARRRRGQTGTDAQSRIVRWRRSRGPRSARGAVASRNPTLPGVCHVLRHRARLCLATSCTVMSCDIVHGYVLRHRARLCLATSCTFVSSVGSVMGWVVVFGVGRCCRAAMGRVAADLVLLGVTAFNIDAFLPSRFASTSLATEQEILNRMGFPLRLE